MREERSWWRRVGRTGRGAGKTARLGLEAMEDRSVPATLALAGGVLTYTAGAEGNNFTVSITGSKYVINDSTPITAAPAGWTGVGTQTVTGPVAGVTTISVDLGGGTDAANVRAVAADIGITSAGNLTVNLSSNAPTNTGNLAAVAGNVTVLGSPTGTNAVVVSNSSAATGSTAAVTDTQITGMLPGGKAVGYANVGSLRVLGSNLAADSFTVDMPASGVALRLDANGGNDAVTVLATSGPTAVNAGAGNDTITVGSAAAGLDFITGALTLDAGAGTGNILNVTDAASANPIPAVATISNSVITGLAPAPITYRALGGAFGGAGITVDGSDAQPDTFVLTGSLAANNLTVNGNGGADSFVVAASTRATLNGGQGDDTFDLGGDGVVLTGSVAGDAGSNALQFSSRAAPVAVTMAGAATGTATGITGTFAGVTALVGGGGSDTLTGPNATNTWTVTGPNAGDFAGGPAFVGFESLTGGAAADTFAFAGGAVAGTVDGAGGSNTLDYSAAVGGVSVTLTGAAAGTGTGLGAFANVAALVGNGATSTLTGQNAATTWALSGTDAGAIAGGPAFTAFANLVGGTADDTFLLSDAGGVSGTIDGGAGGTNTLDYAAVTGYTPAVGLTGAAAGAASNVSGGFAGINNLVGNGTSSLADIGWHAGGDASTWVIFGANAGAIAGGPMFAGFDTLTGGAADDTFAFGPGGSVSGSIDAGAGSDALNFDGYAAGVTADLRASAVTSGAATVVAGFSGIEALSADHAGPLDTVVAPNGPNVWAVTGDDTGTVAGYAFSHFENLTGGTGDDTFVYSGTGTTSGTVAGGGGAVNALQFLGYAASVAVDLQAAAVATVGAGAPVVVAFAGVNDLEADGAADQLVGPNAANTWALTGSDLGTVAGYAFRQFENLTGGAGDDAFVFAGGSVSGTVDGAGGGVNALDYSAVAAPTPVTLAGVASAVGFGGTGPLVGGFSNVTAVQGGSDTSNALTGLNAAATWTVDEAGGSLAYASGGHALAFAGFQLLTGGGGADTFDLLSTAAGSIWTLSGQTGADVFHVSNLDAQLGAVTLAGNGGADALTVDDAGNANPASWAFTVGNVTRDGVSIDYSGIETAVVTTGTGAVAMDVEDSAVGGGLTVNLAGSTNAVDVGLLSDTYGLDSNVQLNLVNAASTGDTLTVHDGAAAAHADWTVSDMAVARSGFASIQVGGAKLFDSVAVLAGDGGATGNTFDVTASAATAFVLDGGVGGNDALTVHTPSPATVGDDGVQITSSTGELPVDYFDFDAAPIVVG